MALTILLFLLGLVLLIGVGEFLVRGAAAIAPIDISSRGQIAPLIATGLTLLLIVLSTTQKKTVVRSEGLPLLAIFAAYMVWVFVFR